MKTYEFYRKENERVFYISGIGFVVFMILAMFNAYLGFFAVCSYVLCFASKIMDSNGKTRRMILELMIQNAKTKKRKEKILKEFER